ncbi:flagellar basal body rod protein FlgC [Egibacter rhizosphaerae]|uniref:Flagellar basal-body rod protein FlgC n=1 Tax=Egibacter rhizosphaerae TaxID=1670831 RepID=A0A411YJF5_9ACTN|nr:flagellar basal body rod protein FlgC [Egibacter rhizosphaerae]QBI21232.1 flagellar basal body rod protein FlgC [Egibacter rhizosphaerae]
MATFGAMDVGRTGLGFSQHWMDQIGHNLANTNTVRGPEEEPFRQRLAVAESLTDEIVDTGSGVHLAGVIEDQRDPVETYEPQHPQADEDGFVAQPVVDMAGQMSDMMQAQRGYQASARTIDTAREAYESALRIGQQ